MAHLKSLFPESDRKTYQGVCFLQKRISTFFVEQKYPQAVCLLQKSLCLLESLQVKQVLRSLEVQLRSLLGLAYFNHESSLEKALNEFDRCSVIEPNNPLVLRRRAQVCYKAKQYEQALRNFQQYSWLCPQDPDVQKHIKQIQSSLKAESKKVEDSLNSTNSLVRFGSFEVIEITREVSDEADARIHKGVAVLSQKSKKSILKDTLSVNSFNTDEKQVDEEVQEFDSSKLKVIDRMSKKEDDKDEKDEAQDLELTPLKKTKSLFIEKQEEMEKDVEMQINSAKLKRKSSLKKSKSVAWRGEEHKDKDDT